MWVAGIMEGLMWRAYDKFGFLQYSFVNWSSRCIRTIVMRLLGGLFFLTGALIMVYNLIHDASCATKPSWPRESVRDPPAPCWRRE